MQTTSCPLCTPENEDIIFANKQWRVILVDDDNYIGFCRVIWHDHIAEMTDLSVNDRQTLMDVVWEVEHAQRSILKAHKINLASLGNMVPHLHWHIIPRYEDDPHFPAPIWAETTKHVTPEMVVERRSRLPMLRQEIQHRLERL